jgi:hypothetical protein
MLIATDFVGTMLMADDAAVQFFVFYVTPDSLGSSLPNLFNALA